MNKIPKMLTGTAKQKQVELLHKVNTLYANKPAGWQAEIKKINVEITNLFEGLK